MKSIRTKSIFLIFCTLALFLCGFFIVGEIVTRISIKKEIDKLIESHAGGDAEKIYKKSDNPNLIYEYKRNTNGTNSQGYFDDEHTFAKNTNTFRIIVIGDSIAAGHGVGRMYAFPELLEGLLNKKIKKHKNVEVIILARSGYAMSQELEILSKEAFLYEPDLIVWSYCLNDPAHPVYHAVNNSEMGFYFYRPKSYLISYLSKLFFNLREVFLAINYEPEFHQILHGIYSDNIKNGIKKISLSTADKNIPVIFIIHPVFEENKDFNEYLNENIHHFLNKTAQDNGLYSLDLLDFYRNYSSSDLKIDSTIGFDPWHPNKLGHEIAAKALYDLILAQNFTGLFVY